VAARRLFGNLSMFTGLAYPTHGRPERGEFFKKLALGVGLSASPKVALRFSSGATRDAKWPRRDAHPANRWHLTSAAM
jgi:hypothetical protein